MRVRSTEAEPPKKKNKEKRPVFSGNTLGGMCGESRGLRVGNRLANEPPTSPTISPAAATTTKKKKKKGKTPNLPGYKSIAFGSPSRTKRFAITELLLESFVQIANRLWESKDPRPQAAHGGCL